MTKRIHRQCLFLLTMGAAYATHTLCAQAAIVIPTNQNGADAEVRKSDLNPDGMGNLQGTNRGTSFELATRLRDRTTGGTSDRSSAIYLKFDISGITAADLAANPYANLRLNVGAVNMVESRQTAPSPADANTTVEMEFKLRGLTNFALGNWDESTITYYNAPGITPDSTHISMPPNPGQYDFNSDMPELGAFKLSPVGRQNHLAVGSPVDYTESAMGPLHQLVADAISAGETHLTLAVHHGLDGFEAADMEAPGTTPTSMLNHNYLFIPKEITALNNSNGQPNHLVDTNYDWNTNDAIPGGPGPFLDAINAGAFSPKLILSVNPIPEPSSMALVALGMLATTGIIRRRK